MICKDCIYHTHLYGNKDKRGGAIKTGDWCCYNGGKKIKNKSLKQCKFYECKTKDGFYLIFGKDKLK